MEEKSTMGEMRTGLNTVAVTVIGAVVLVVSIACVLAAMTGG